jgi:hypothetical protein
MKTGIPPFDSEIKYILIPNDSYSHYQHCSDLWAFERNAIVYYQITQLSEQKYRLAIPFAENNFGPFEHIVFVIVLFESPSKTLFRMLLASLYLKICIFYQYISISCPTVSLK